MKALANISNYFATHPLTRNAQLAAWLRFAKWQIRSRMSDEVIVHWIEGQKLAARRSMVGATGNIYAGLHEFEDMMLPLHFLREGDLFLDVGANVGSFTVLAAGVCLARVWAFEPDPGTVGYLRRNIAINGLHARVHVHQLALGANDGQVAFTVGQDSTNQVAPEGATNVQMVSIARLDSVLGDETPVMIKMDVEGHEEHVVRGATETLKRSSLKVVELETTSESVRSALAGHGFEQAYYDPFSRKLSREPVSVSAQNSLYVRDWDFVAQRVASARAVAVLGRPI